MKKILLVDDDPFILDVYSRQLKRDGYHVDIANNEDKALRKILDNGMDLLILDLNLNTGSPGPKQGLDLLKTLRSHLRTKNLKVIVISNYNMSDYPEMSEIESLGVSKILLKVQSHPEDLSKEVKNILVN